MKTKGLAFTITVLAILSSGCQHISNWNGLGDGSYAFPSYSGFAAPTAAPSAPSHIGGFGLNPYDPDSLANPYGAGSPYKPDGLLNPFSQYGSPYSNTSWKNPFATDAPKLYDSEGNYRGKLSTNPYEPDSTSNPFGRYGSPFSPESVTNPFGPGSPYSTKPIYVVPSK